MGIGNRSQFPGQAVIGDGSEAVAHVETRLSRHVGKRGGRVVDANLDLIKAAYRQLIDVTAWLGQSRHGRSAMEEAA